jgi:cell division protein FtsN
VRRQNSRPRGNFILGLCVGLVAGLAIALGVAFYLSKTPLPFLGGKAKPAAKEGSNEPPKIAGMPQGGAPSARSGADKDRPKYDFYKILPGGEEPVPEREAKGAKDGRDAKEAKDAKDAPKTAAVAPKGQPEPPRGVFFIQAGSFQNPADADNQKAKIAILGFSSSVEPTTLPDKGTWYRVRMGPYTSLEDLNKVRRVLTQNGIDASLVKPKDPAKDN